MTHSTHLQKLGAFDTIVEALDYASGSEACATFYAATGQVESTISYAQLRANAQVIAQRLASLHLPRYARVGLLGETGPDFLIAFHACQYAGLVPCPLPLTVYMGGKDAYTARLASMASAAGLSLLLSPASLLGCVVDAAATAGATGLGYDSLPNLPEGDTPQPLEKDDPAYIQYSSGSTSHPKGVLVSQRALCANVRGILQHGLKVTPADRAFSWLPFYHDMGLVGFHFGPLFSQIDADYLSPSTFARRPTLWLDLMSANGTTITFAPSFGYKLVSDRCRKSASQWDLQRLRVAGIGGDLIRPDVLDEFALRFEAAGFRPEAFMPSYGLAEGVLAVTFSDLSAPPGIQEPNEAGRRYVVCGAPLPGIDLAVVDANGVHVPDRTIGHIWVRGPSVMKEYFNNAAATKQAFRLNGYLDTGDLGYLVDGGLVVTGRKKDLVLWRGRNVWPEDIEWAATRIAPLRAGDAAAFGVETGTDEDVVLLVQCGLADREDRESLRARVKTSVSEAVGVSSRVVLVPPRSLPHTSSGKLARWQARQLYLDGNFATKSATVLDDEECPM